VVPSGELVVVVDEVDVDVLVLGSVVVVTSGPTVDVVNGEVVDVDVVDVEVVDVDVVDVDVVVVVDVDVVDVDVVVVTGTSGPQNWTLEMSGRLPEPTGGSRSLLNVPDVWGGEYDVTTPLGPPFTTTAEIGTVEDHDPPVAVAFVIVTTDSLPGGVSKTYRPPWYSNFATSTEPAGHSMGTVALVVRSSPTVSKTTPTIITAMPTCHGRTARKVCRTSRAIGDSVEGRSDAGPASA
jgi:hypothetical protein